MPGVQRVTMADGAALGVRVVGRGPAVVMLPGLGMASAHWLPFVAPFVRRFRFYLPDYRGFATSRDVAPRGPDLFAGHAADLVDLLAGLGLRDVVLVGYSLGASTSLHHLRDFGFAGVRRYLHIDQSPYIGTAPDWPHGLLGARQAEAAAAFARVCEVLDARAPLGLVGDLDRAARHQLADALAGLAARFGFGAARGLAAALRLPRPLLRRLPLTDLRHLRAVMHAYASGGHDYRPALPSCPVPITVFVGMRSALYDPRGQLVIADLAPRASVVRFPDAGHLLAAQRPRAFVRALGAFLADV